MVNQVLPGKEVILVRYIECLNTFTKFSKEEKKC
jgi:hypothetical protein